MGAMLWNVSLLDIKDYLFMYRSCVAYTEEVAKNGL